MGEAVTDFQQKWLNRNSGVSFEVPLINFAVHCLFRHILFCILCAYFLFSKNEEFVGNFSWGFFVFSIVFFFVFIASTAFSIQLCAVSSYISNLIFIRDMNHVRDWLPNWKYSIASAVTYRTTTFEKLTYFVEAVGLYHLIFHCTINWQLLIGFVLIVIGFTTFSIASFVSAIFCKRYVDDYVNPVSVAILEGISYKESVQKV